jgi:hypothetical protein
LLSHDGPRSQKGKSSMWRVAPLQAASCSGPTITPVSFISSQLVTVARRSRVRWFRNHQFNIIHIIRSTVCLRVLPARSDKNPDYVRLGTEYPHKARQYMVRRLLFLPLVVDVIGPA